MSRIKFLFSTFLALSALAAQAQSYSNCPEISAIQLTCSGNICNWSADHPGWEGFTRIPGHGKDTQIVKFISADWWNYSHNVRNGEMRCWYKGDQGGLILMTQGRWGGIEQPMKMNWQPKVDPAGKSVLACSATDPQSCPFTDNQ